MATAKQVVNVAASQVGYKEGKNNWTKYGADYGMNNCAWCMIFVWWCFKQAGAESLIKKSASCTAEWNAMKAQAVSKNSLKAGDIVFFDWDHSGDCDHVGIVEAAGSSQVTTIEGNTSAGNSGSQSNGDGVYRRYRSYSQIAKAFRPKYESEPAPSGNAYIKAGQKKANEFLKKYGNGTKIEEDGIRGPETKKQAVRVLQICMNKDYGAGLVVDGDFGTKSNKALGSHYVAYGEKQWMVTAAEILLMLKGKDVGGVEYPGIFGSGLQNAAGKKKITASDFKSYIK